MTPPAADGGGSRILVVDDSAAMRDSIAAVLRAGGFEVVQAADGHEALAAIEQTPGLALVILDLNMPRLNGLEVLESMRIRHLPAVPTVMLTTEAQSSYIQRAKNAGAKGWLVKPVKDDHLLAVARRLAGAAAPPGTAPR